MGERSTSGWGDRGESLKGEEEGLKYPIEKSAAIPFMITRDMRRQLIEDMNYSRKEVNDHQLSLSFSHFLPCCLFACHSLLAHFVLTDSRPVIVSFPSFYLFLSITPTHRSIK